MGWFLNSNKKKKRATHRRYQTQKVRSWDPQRTLKGLKYLSVAVLVVGFVLGWRYAERYLGVYASLRVGGAVNADDVVLLDAPLWMNPVLTEDIRRSVANQVEKNLLDYKGLERAVFVLSVNPWIERVWTVARSDRGRVRVSVQFREPVAVVEGRDGYHLVDARGVRLPGLYLQHQLDELELPVIVGVSAPPSQEGEAWPGKDLHAGLSLVRLLGGEPYLQQVHRIDVGHRDARGRVRLMLHTQRGLVRWGLPPGMERTIEPDAAIKKMWLADVYRQRGSIDAGGKIVDVYGAAVFIHQPTYDDQGVASSYTLSR